MAAEDDDDSGVVNIHRGFSGVEGVTSKENANFKRNISEKTEERI